MNLNVTSHRKWIIGGAVLFLTATPGLALFGMGDIVFDPTSYGSLVQQLTTIREQFTMLKNNITHFSLKQQWQSTLQTLENVNVANIFGETAGIRIALNSNTPGASMTAWKAATISMNSNVASYLQGQPLGSSRMSQLAMIETSDAISPDCLTAVGQYRSARNENMQANTSLSSQQFDDNDNTNSEVQQLNLLNAAEAQKLSEIEAQGALQACLASQMMVSNMERRDAAAEDLNTVVFVQQQRAINDSSAANEGSTWNNYLP
jgi:hypothetical protein